MTFFSENHAVCGTMWKNIVQSDRPQMTIWRMQFAFSIADDTITHSEYVTLTDFHCNSGYTNAPQYDVIRTLTSY